MKRFIQTTLSGLMLLPALLTAQTSFTGDPDPNVAITDNGCATPQTHVITVSGLNNTINTSAGLDRVCINFTHTYVSDLRIHLIAPDNTTVELTTDNGLDGDNYTNTCFDMSATTAIASVTNFDAPFTGTYVPEGDLDNVNNSQNANGDWVLQYCDNDATASGTFDSWSLHFDASLPVELSYFGATANLTGVQLKWTTESETENLGFVLERRTGEADFTEIASYKTDDALLGQGSVEYATEYEYVDSFVEVGETYEYRLGDVDYAGTVTYHAARTVTVTTAPLDAKVEHFTVLAAYPNPFNPSTTLRYALPQTEANYTTTVQIYDLTGKLVKTLLNATQPAGWHSVVWHGTDQFGSRVPAGVYLSKVSFGSETKTIKVMLLK